MANKLDETRPIVINGTLYGWHIFTMIDGTCMIGGTIYGDTKGRFIDGQYIYTSLVTEGPTPLGYVKTENSVYYLKPKEGTTEDSRQGVEL